MWRLQGLAGMTVGSSALRFEQLFQLRPKRRCQVGPVQGVGDIGQQEADLVAAVVDRAVEAHREEGLARRQA